MIGKLSLVWPGPGGIKLEFGQARHNLPCPVLVPHNENVNVRIGDYLSIFSLD